MPMSQTKNAAPTGPTPSAMIASHCPTVSGQHRGLDHAVDERGKQRGGETEAGDRVGRHRLELARHHRIGRPHKGGDEGCGQARYLAGRKARAIAGEQQHGAGKPEQRADDMMRRQSLARQQRGEQHDQQRPEIIQQTRFRRRREAQREEIQRVIAEQAADADDPGDQRLLQGTKGGGPEQETGECDQRADRKCHRGKLECRDLSGRDRQHRQQRPHQDRGQSDERGGAGGHDFVIASGAKQSIPSQ